MFKRITRCDTSSWGDLQHLGQEVREFQQALGARNLFPFSHLGEVRQQGWVGDELLASRARLYPASSTRPACVTPSASGFWLTSGASYLSI